LIKLEFFDIFFKNTEIYYFRKIPIEAELFRADRRIYRRTDMTEVVFFRSSILRFAIEEVGKDEGQGRGRA
jgi:hypothetical protein